MARSYVSYHPGLMTDMYHPDAAYVSWRAGRNGRATFDLFARRAPFGGSYLLVAGLVIIEIKAVKALAPEHQAQVINYLKATGVEVGLLINFGNAKLEYKRLTREKEKEHG